MYATGLDDSFGATDVSFAATKEAITSPYRQNTQPSYEDLEQEYKRLRVVNFNLKLSLMNMEEALQELDVGPEVADLVLQNAQLKAEVRTKSEQLRELQEEAGTYPTQCLRYRAQVEELEAQLLAAHLREQEAARALGDLAEAKDGEVQQQVQAAEGLRLKNEELLAELEELTGHLHADTKERANERDEARSFRAQYDRLKAHQGATLAELRDAEDRVAQGLERLHDAEVAKEIELAEVAERHRHSAHALRKLEDDVVEMEAEITELKAQLADERGRSTRSTEDSDKRLERRLAAKETECSLKWQAEANELRERIQAYEESLRLAEGQDARREELMGEYQATLRDMEAEAEQVRMSLDEANTAIASYVEGTRELEVDNEALRQQVQEHAEETQRLTAAASGAEASGVQLRSERDEALRQLTTLQTHIEDLEAALDAVRAGRPSPVPASLHSSPRHEADTDDEASVQGIDMRRPTVPVTDEVHIAAREAAARSHQQGEASDASSNSTNLSPRLRDFAFPSVDPLDIQGTPHRRPSKLLEKRRASRADALQQLQQGAEAAGGGGAQSPGAGAGAGVSQVQDQGTSPFVRRSPSPLASPGAGGQGRAKNNLRAARASRAVRSPMTPQARPPPQSAHHYRSAYRTASTRREAKGQQIDANPLMDLLSRVSSRQSLKATTPTARSPRQGGVSPRGSPRSASPRAGPSPAPLSPAASSRSILRATSFTCRTATPSLSPRGVPASPGAGGQGRRGTPRSTHEMCTSPLSAQPRSPLLSRQGSMRWDPPPGTPRAPVELHEAVGAPLSPLLRRMDSQLRNRAVCGTPRSTSASQPPTPGRRMRSACNSPLRPDVSSLGTSPRVGLRDTAAAATSPASFGRMPSPRREAVEMGTSPRTASFRSTRGSPRHLEDAVAADSVGVSDSDAWDHRVSPRAASEAVTPRRLEKAMQKMARTLSPLVLPPSSPALRTLSGRNSPRNPAPRTLSPLVAPHPSARTLSPFAMPDVTPSFEMSSSKLAGPFSSVSPRNCNAELDLARRDIEQLDEELRGMRAHEAELVETVRLLECDASEAHAREVRAEAQLQSYKLVSLGVVGALSPGGGLRDDLRHEDVIEAAATAVHCLDGLRAAVEQGCYGIAGSMKGLAGVPDVLRKHASRLKALQGRVGKVVRDGRSLRAEATRLQQCVARHNTEQQQELARRMQAEDQKLKLEFEVTRLRTSLEVTEQTCQQQSQELDTRRADLCQALDKVAQLELRAQGAQADHSKSAGALHQLTQDLEAKKLEIASLTQRCSGAEAAVGSDIERRVKGLNETISGNLFSLRDFIDECGWGRQTLGLSGAFLESISGCVARCHQVLQDIYALGRHADHTDHGMSRSREVSPLRSRGGASPELHPQLHPHRAPCVHTAIAKHESKTVEMMVERLESLSETLHYHGQQRQLSLKNILQRITQLEETVVRQLHAVSQIFGNASVGDAAAAAMSPVNTLSRRPMSHSFSTNKGEDTWQPLSPSGMSPMHRGARGTTSYTMSKLL